jgi:peptidyl-prolyl cis-trans isomerase C
MRLRKSALLAAGVTLATALATVNVVAELDPGGGSVVAKVGSRSVTARAFVQRLAVVPDFQLATFGSSPSEIKRNFLEQVVVRDELFSQGAEAKKLDQVTRARERIDHALRNARINLLRENLDVGAGEIASYFAENRARFEAPERIAVTRILCATRSEAVTVLADAKSVGTPQRWNELTREHSLDKATSMRGGALGFLAQDGSSSEASVRVDPALFAAASKVKDGEFVPEPIEDGKSYAVIWRRGSTPAVHRTLEEETGPIRQILVRQKLAAAVKALTDSLRGAEKIEEHPDLVDLRRGRSEERGSAQASGVAKRRPAEPPRLPRRPPAS